MLSYDSDWMNEEMKSAVWLCKREGAERNSQILKGNLLPSSVSGTDSGTLHFCWKQNQDTPFILFVVKYLNFGQRCCWHYYSKFHPSNYSIMVEGLADGKWSARSQPGEKNFTHGCIHGYLNYVLKSVAICVGVCLGLFVSFSSCPYSCCF